MLLPYTFAEKPLSLATGSAAPVEAGNKVSNFLTTGLPWSQELILAVWKPVPLDFQARAILDHGDCTVVVKQFRRCCKMIKQLVQEIQFLLLLPNHHPIFTP